MKGKYRFRHPEGRYIQVMFSFRPGKWVSTGTHDTIEAVRFADRMCESSTPPQDRKVKTLRDFAEGFFSKADPWGYRKRLMRRGVEYDESYFIQHQARLDNYILPAHGDYLINSITDIMIEDFVLDLESYRNKGVQLSNDSKNKVLTCYRIVLQEATRQGYTRSNQAKDVVELARRDNPRECFTEEELRLLFPDDDTELLRIWTSLRWATYFIVLRDTGWRPGEAAALQITGYFPELHGVYTTGSVDYRSHRPKATLKTTKKGQRFKEGFLSDQGARMMEALIREVAGKSDYVFEAVTRFKDEAFIYSELANKRLRASAEIAGVALHGRTQYSFRHTFNTYYIGRLPEMARLILMGHKKNRQEYNHLTGEQSLRRVLAIEGTAEALGVTIPADIERVESSQE